ncbi:response regulator transcription factor [Microbulbifer marinus]|uniref:DNA-binding response regulator, OmpR family, contains REC and winged-helix (WHTH) domain n=1 Tax=Microbulbifer marinus TaxID=658218 RepID=A0A1H4AZQ5_9GAMM|nr:response regulator transcription factor [Microbulbifer marinus]SEA41267.1 DNA-binding response regulator, OmpR family, contains REC and winged-helix (wHTH) domain [Microbulbifer marinus]
MKALKILLIEDNPTIARQTGEFLGGHGWHIDFAHCGRLGQELALEQIYDLIVLDLNLPDMDGLEVCRRIKEQATVNMPVLMLTARDAFSDMAEGFNTGADDYLCKPFDPRELALRCRALARRNELHQSDKIRIGDLVIRRREHSACREGQALQLTTIGFQILSILARAYPQPVSRSEILHQIWGDNPPETDALKSHIYSLRQALDKHFSAPMLKTITNLGYRLEVPGAGQ